MSSSYPKFVHSQTQQTEKCQSSSRDNISLIYANVIQLHNTGLFLVIEIHKLCFFTASGLTFSIYVLCIMNDIILIIVLNYNCDCDLSYSYITINKIVKRYKKMWKYIIIVMLYYNYQIIRNNNITYITITNHNLKVCPMIHMMCF